MSATARAFWRKHDPTLQRMWTEGITLPAIAKALGLTYGAVNSRRTRLKLSPRRPSYKALSAAEKRANLKLRNHAYWLAHREEVNATRKAWRRANGVKAAAPRAKRVVVPAPQPVVGRAVPLLLLKPRDCRWPVSAEAPHLFCAIPVASKSYCAYHAWKSLYHKEERTSADVRPRSNYHPSQLNFRAYQAR